MELRRYLRLLRQRLLLVTLTVVAGLAGGYLIGKRTPTYQTQTSIYVGSRQPAGGTTSTDIIQLDRLIATYAAMIKSVPVAQGAIRASHAPRSPGQVIAETTAVVVTNTNLIDISVTDTNPAVAQSLADGVASSFIGAVQQVSAASGGSANSPTVSVFQPANLPGAPIATSRKRDLALGGLLGLVVSAGVVLLVDYLDITIKSADDLERSTKLPVLGTVAMGRPGSTGPLPVSS